MVLYNCFIRQECYPNMYGDWFEIGASPHPGIHAQ